MGARGEKEMKVDKKKIEIAVRMILEALNEDLNREGLRDTPRRVADMYEEIFSGYNINSELNVVFMESSDLVIARGIRFYSICEHHLLPFFGFVNIAYIPNGKVLGISKLAKLINKYAQRLQLQERMTNQIADELYSSEARPLGVIVLTTAKHTCMMMRGVEKQNSKMITSAMLGSFHKSAATRNEFLQLIGFPELV